MTCHAVCMPEMVVLERAMLALERIALSLEQIDEHLTNEGKPYDRE